MATPTGALHQIRRTRRQESPPPSRNFEEYRAHYELLLAEVGDLGGDAAIDELTAWMVETTERTGELPPPDEVAARGRDVCDRRDVELPAGSPLAADDADARDVYAGMEQLEPYTTGEVAERVGVGRSRARKLLDGLAGRGRLHGRRTDEGEVWMRRPPTEECPDCGGRFEVSFAETGFVSVEHCPRCGAGLV